MAGTDTKQFTDQSFDSEVLKAREVVLVDFWAPWCAPCRALGPIVDAVAGELRGRAKIGKVNVDDNPGISRQYGILSIPILLVFKDGKLVDNMVGSGPKAKILSMLEPYLDTAGVQARAR